MHLYQLAPWTLRTLQVSSDLAALVLSAFLAAVFPAAASFAFFAYSLARFLANYRRQPHVLENYVHTVADTGFVLWLVLTVTPVGGALALAGLVILAGLRVLWLSPSLGLFAALGASGLLFFAAWRADQEVGLIFSATASAFLLAFSGLLWVTQQHKTSRLWNKSWFALRAQERIGCGWRDRKTCPMSDYGVFFVSLENYAEIQEGFGDPVARQIERHIANTLLKACNEWGYVAQFDHTKFIVLDADFRTEGEAKARCEAIKALLTREAALLEEHVHVDLIVAGAKEESCHLHSSELIRDAYLALKCARRENQPVFALTNEDRDKIIETIQTRAKLEKALERDEFFLAIQPVMDARDGVIVGAEALLRWRHGGKVIPPFKFIEIAENSGLIIDIGAWVMRTAADQWAEIMQDCGLDTPWISVNVSVHQLYEWETLKAALAYALSRGVKLKVEITESAAVEGQDTFLARLREIQAMGAELAIDDFGTGYSSLSRLHEFGADCLKIDRCFVQRLGKPDGVQAIQAIAKLAQCYGMAVVVEGIETELDRAALVSMGLIIHQGYFYSKPIEQADLAAFVRAHAGVQDPQGVSAPAAQPLGEAATLVALAPSA